MKKLIGIVMAAALIIAGPSAVMADELVDFAARVSAKAALDFGAFKVKVGTEFGHDQPRVEAVIKVAGSAGDAYLCFQLGKALKKPPEEIATYYSKNKGKGWGVIAKDLGIKPGSPEFHALKKGKFGDDDDKGKGGKSDDKGGKPDDKGKGGKPDDKGGKPDDKGKGGGKGKSK